LLTWHEKTGAKATILSSILTDSTGYGRIVRASDNQVEKIVEHKDASEKEKEIKEINTGTYCFDNQALFAALKLVGNENVQGEYYLPDVIEILKQQGERIEAFVTPHFEETLGVNDRFALSEASAIMKKRILKQHMLNGVTILDADSTYIEADVTIGRDTVLHPGTVLRAQSKIGEDCEIGPNTEIIASTVHDEVVIRQSVVTESTIAKGATVGPFAHIRPGSNVGENNRIGNFVELKNTTLGTGSKVSHLSYVGDAEIGANVNVGCGAVTVNYDGYKKYKTIIEDESFIGCNANLIAPITVEKGSYVAAGSTISKNVPQGALAIARARQENKEGYAAKLKK
ncbi:MAG: bifunctional UDP-N-acetylglucosamine diphosphorylase/glucosamine-1-phosphate N-acetyltransferase GlmU, partial [Bacilli bacterium]